MPEYPIASFLDDPEPRYFGEGTLVEVKDGDTWVSDIDVGHQIVKKRITMRPSGYDTAETWRPKSTMERAHGERATEKLKILLERPVTHRIETLHEETGIIKYSIGSRWEVHAHIRDEELYGVPLMPVACIMRLEGYQKKSHDWYTNMKESSVKEGVAFRVLLDGYLGTCSRHARKVYELLRNNELTPEDLIDLSLEVDRGI